MKPILCRVLSCQSGVLVLEDVQSKHTIKRYTKRTYEPKTILVLLNEEILTYSYKTKKLLKQYREQKQFENLVQNSPYKQQYKQTVKRIGVLQFYEQILTSNKDKPLKQKLLKRYTKKYKVIFKLNLPLYQKQCFTKLNKLVQTHKDIVQYIGGEQFCIISSYNTLNEKPYHKFTKNYQEVTEINTSSVRVIL